MKDAIETLDSVRKLLFVSAAGTVFVTYPNAVWIPWNLARLADGEQPGFWAFFVFRVLYFFGLFYFQLRFDRRRLGNASFAARFAGNFLFTFVACAAFVGLSYGLPLLGVRTGYVGNILIFQFVVVFLLCVFISHIGGLYRSRREKESEIERLRVENLQSRCDALTNQINPHFFFNALNGISSLIRKKNDADALLYVDKLSDIFRYILQSDRKGLATLGEELEFIGAFLHVMEVRFANKLRCSTDVPAEKRGLLLPVLSILPLMENVAVHNVIDSGHRMEIRIRLNEDDELEVSNPMFPKPTPPDTNGIGLRNLGNRFRLMTKREIRTERDGNVFRVILPLIEKTP